ncbi:hypothetical protein AVEN_24517-1 [Araneus ventricosus]|uniref:Uncharacterized protein n=1 Tax=Araneus ventricosus TaxID=182803 RepID=A0A4Y2TGI4_ARAVE|nr:hypothetical protein AVEN_24517-1 [Araneus ventricosus]
MRIPMEVAPSVSSPPSTTSVNLTSLLCAAKATIREPASSDPVTRCLQLNELTKQLKRLSGTIPLIMCDADIYVQLDNGHFLSTKDSLMDVLRHAIDALASDIASFAQLINVIFQKLNTRILWKSLIMEVIILL